MRDNNSNTKSSLVLGQKKKIVIFALSRPTVKCEKTGSFFFFFFFFFMSDLGEEFAKICIQWPKKALVYMRFDCIAFRPSFPHLETLKKILENSTLSRYVKKKRRKKKIDRPTQFSNFGRVRAT